MKNKIDVDLESRFPAGSAEMERERAVLTAQLEWMNEMEEFAGLKNQDSEI